MTQTDRDDKMREAFKAWCESLGCLPFFITIDYAGIDYRHTHLKLMWRAWQAALHSRQQLSEDEAVKIMRDAIRQEFMPHQFINRTETHRLARAAYRALLAAQTKDRSDSVPGISQGKEASASFHDHPALRTELANSCEGGLETSEKE